jgi:hypothetical protein
MVTPSLPTVGRGTLYAVSAVTEHRAVPLTMKIVPWARVAELLAASRTPVTVGAGGPVVPEYVRVPGPAMLKVPVPEPEFPEPVPAAVTLVKVPVAPANPPVPPVMAMDPVPLTAEVAKRICSSSKGEAVNVPVSVPVVLPLVMVRVIGMLPVVRLDAPAVAPNVPLAVSPPAKVTVPVAVTLPVLVLILPDPLIEIVVLIVAACAPTHSQENKSPPRIVLVYPLVAARCNCIRIFSPP